MRATFAALLCLLLCAAVPAQDAPAKRPQLAVDTVDGDRFDLTEHRGRWVIVNFWATWCAPCIKEMPELRALDQAREDVVVVGLAYEEISGDDMRAFLERRPAGYPIAILDVFSPPADFATPRGLPTTYVIDPDGDVAKHFLGPVTQEDLRGVIDAEAG